MSLIQPDFVRTWRINNLKDKQGNDKPNGSIYTIMYSYDPGCGRVRYGACKFTRKTTKDIFHKKKHNDTAYERYTKYPVYFDICFESSAPSQILHEVRYCIQKMLFVAGMKCRHPDDHAMIAKPFECEVKLDNLKNGKLIHKVTLVPMNTTLIVTNLF